MGAIKLELQCPQSVDGVVIEPQPDWTFDSLLSELSSIEKKLNTASAFPLPFAKTKLRDVSPVKSVERGAFVMRVDEMEDLEEDKDEVVHVQQLVPSRRFVCDELSISDNSEDELPCSSQSCLMDKVGLIEGAVIELTHEHQLSVTDDIRNRILALETDLLNEDKKFNSALFQVKKHTEMRQEMDRKLDMQYQRKIAEALDNHLTAIQRHYALKSQIEERRIRDDAAIEEARGREKALQEEKLRQEKARADAEARLEAERKKAEEAKAAALEAERKAAKEAAAKIDKEYLAKPAATAIVAPKEDAVPQADTNKSGSDNLRKAQQAGNVLKCAESALKLEERRLQIYNEVALKNEMLAQRSGSGQVNHGSKINRLIRQISGTKENVRTKTDQLTQIFFDASCPQSISVAAFVEKIVEQCLNPNKAVFAYAHVIVLVATKVPLAMDLVLAQLNKVCIYTVPKYINYSKSAFDSKEAYQKAIGYKEEDGKIESEENYASGIESYMRLYGALIQTEIKGVKNPHGLEEGWAWLARFLNNLPANQYTAIALQAFLQMAGFALFRRYKSQFKKLLMVIYRDFVTALKERGDAKLNKTITNMQAYIESKKFHEEPEGRSLQSTLLSSSMAPEPDNPEPSYNRTPTFYQRPASRFYYQY
ncbi:hypothetical protein NMG60_11024833 [Bertholletia excelsa]